jgi:hypothetical protein
MPKPPKSTPHSDIDGVNQDQVRNTDAAEASGETTANLELARAQAKGHPRYDGEEEAPKH